VRDFKAWPPGAGAAHQLMTGAPLGKPLTQLSASPGGSRMEEVIPLAAAGGDVQAALSAGGTGTLKRAGRP
jgi:hypothetical protein